MPPETIDSLDDDLKPMVHRIVAQNASLLGRIDELLAQNAKVHAQNTQGDSKNRTLTGLTRAANQIL